MIDTGARRTVVIFLVILTLIVCIRALSSAHGPVAAGDASLAPAGSGTPDEAHLLLLPFARSRVALYDPGGRAATALGELGLPFETFDSFRGLALYAGDLIVVGPGAFGRGDEDLGPILAARARSGMRVLLLDQASLPGTLSDALRLWPSFDPDSVTDVVLAPSHPILRGLQEAAGASFFARAPVRARPLLPPIRGNFRVIAEARSDSGPSSQEGIALLEVPIGAGVVLAAQASLCADVREDPQARLVLANALAYLLGERPSPARVCLYAGDVRALPLCLKQLAPAPRSVPSDFAGVDVILAPYWQAGNSRPSSHLPPLASVARFLHEGGTLVLLNPQSLVADFLRVMTGCQVVFESSGPALPPALPLALPASDDAAPLLMGIDGEDLRLLAHPERAELRLRARGGADAVEPLLIAPGLAEYRVGRGRLVALTRPEASTCAAPRVSSLLARILTNLGVPLDPGPSLDPRTITRLSDPDGD
jgi:hypothetical protein